KQIKITSAKTRWGSCSAKGTVSFPWRLVMAPVPVIDYVVVHELVHILEKNHSRAFWNKVRAIMPDYQQKIRWLEVNGYTLMI
ncbi:MAG: M48 family metallopeptidase, partial [Anaerolineae bacterium]|nr:M48 family metallopeptidase [Anaerolineae bacterium]